MQTYQVGLLGLGVFALLALLAFISWSRRVTVQKNSLAKPISIEGSAKGNNCFYVATTFADRALSRVIAHGLAHRGHANLGVSELGLEVSRTGELSFLIPKQDLLEVTKATAVIDRAVETNGLLVIKWRLGSVELDTHFRFVDAQLRSKTINDVNTLVGE